MKERLVQTLALGLALAGTPAAAEGFTLVNASASRPVFALEAKGATQTRSLAPGRKVWLPAGLFSGVGENRTPVGKEPVYYLAGFGPTVRLYALGRDQVLILNQAGRPVALRLSGRTVVEGVMAEGSLALGALSAEGTLTAEWSLSDGPKTRSLEPGRVYRLVLDSPQGVGVEVALIPWD